MVWLKLHALNIMHVMTSLVIGAVLILLIQQQTQNAKQLKINTQILDSQKQILLSLKQTANDLKTDNHSDHDTQIKYVQCIVNLFGSKPGQIITQAEFDACLGGTRITPQASRSSSFTVPMATITPTLTPALRSAQNGSGSNKGTTQRANPVRRLVDWILALP